MKDHLIRIVDEQNQIRVFLARTTGLVEEARRRHGTSPTASAALGRVLTAALIMASDFKNPDDRLSIRVDGGGPAGPIVAAADSQGQVRGYVTHPEADLPARAPGKLAVGELVGRDGFLEVIKDMGLKEPFSGRVSLVSGEIAEDLASYFYYSEQVPALVSLGVLVDTDISVKAAGGLVVQAMPGASEELLETLEGNILAGENISALIDARDSLEEIAALVMAGVPFSVVEQMDLSYRCNCERERMLGILATLSWEELEGLKDEKIEIVCHFCNARYGFDYAEIAARKEDVTSRKNESPGC